MYVDHSSIHNHLKAMQNVIQRKWYIYSSPSWLSHHFAVDVLARCHFTTRNLKCGQLAWATVICNGVGSHYGVKEMLLLGSEGIQRQMRARMWALASLIKCAIKFVLVWRQTASNCPAVGPVNLLLWLHYQMLRQEGCVFTYSSKGVSSEYKETENEYLLHSKLLFVIGI